MKYLILIALLCTLAVQDDTSQDDFLCNLADREDCSKPTNICHDDVDFSDSAVLSPEVEIPSDAELSKTDEK
jgi:hypothetical protein